MAETTTHTARRWETIVGIDPGHITGLACLRVPPAPWGGDVLDVARLVTVLNVHGKPRQVWQESTYGDPDTEHPEYAALVAERGRLFRRVRWYLDRWHPDHVVIEDPVDGLALWKQEAAGTAYTLGARFMACYAAALGYAAEVADIRERRDITAQPAVRIATYPIATKPRKRNRPGHLGWMQGNGETITRREDTLRAMQAWLAHLIQRPYDGKLPPEEVRALTAGDVESETHANRLMALGVVRFHLSRERGHAAAPTTPASPREQRAKRQQTVLEIATKGRGHHL